MEDMPVVHRHAAGIDLGGDVSHFVAVEVGDEVEVREFGGMTPELLDMVTYLAEHAVTTVAMESTGVYWMPLYDLLEAAGFEVYLVNPAHVKNVPGRRHDDKLDCRWLQKLHKYGLLSASFRPSEEIRPLRSFHRQRNTVVRLAADEMRRMQKALDVMNIRIHKAICDLGGVTGLRIVRAIVDGQRDPETLAAMRDPRCKCSPEELRQALTGSYQAHQVLALKQALERYDFLMKQLAALDQEIEKYLIEVIPATAEEIAVRIAAAAQKLPDGKHAPRYNVAAYVEMFTGYDPTCLPGIGPQIAFGLLAELGRDMSKWQTEKHFGAYLALSPQQKISGGKLLSTKTRPGSHPAAVLFRQAAAAVIRTDSALGAFYRRMAVKIGTAKALVATAYKIARMYYHLMRDGRAYIELGVQQYEEKYRKQQIAALEKKAKRLGLMVTPAAA
jgi:transposase